MILELTPDESQIVVVQAACEAEGDFEVGIAVFDDAAERVVLDSLYHVAARVGNNAEAADLIVYE
ncbi:hypothetical protein [uncultured Pseudodesulfovibrio sp.]|uniref:hypothetical protein n=1 Tax=uncultured Pseudodesulfovibrio sp. TaxID=2035858 RepID=UPI0029C7EB41|nr:hypothetical protein [uncultured Pseudodesulfovibrio sp.]